MKVQNPIIGRARGSAGGMTFCKNYDKNVARAKAFEVSNPNTQAQQTQRAFFAELTALCSDFSDDQLRFLFPSKPKTMSRRNALSKQIAQSYAIDGTEKTIDFADIDTLGNAPVRNFGEVLVSPVDTHINVNFNQIVTLQPELSHNDIVIVALNNTLKQKSMVIPGETVADSESDLNYPTNWSDNDDISAVVLVANTKNGVGYSAGFSSMFAIARPARKND